MDTTLITKALNINIVEALGLQSLPEERKLALVDSLTQLVGIKIMERIEEKLSPQDQQAFSQALESGTEAQVDAWLAEKGIDAEHMAVEEIAKIKDDLASRADAVDAT